MSKVTFNGDARTITLNSGTTQFDVQTDIYSEWKTWSLNNAQYAQAMRSAGGDPLPGNKLTGRYYFLLNNWKLVPNLATTADIEIDGNLFTEDGSNLFITSSGVQMIRQTVSPLSTITIVSGSGGSGGLTESQSIQLTDIQNKTTVNSQSLSTIITSQSLQQTDLDTIIVSEYINSGTLSIISTDIDALLSTSGSSLTPQQSTMLLEMYRLLGLDPTRPLIVNPTNKFSGPEVSQSIQKNGSTVTVMRL